VSAKDYEHLAELTLASDRDIEHPSALDQRQTVNGQRFPVIGTLLQQTDQAREDSVTSTAPVQQVRSFWTAEHVHFRQVDPGLFQVVTSGNAPHPVVQDGDYAFDGMDVVAFFVMSRPTHVNSSLRQALAPPAVLHFPSLSCLLLGDWTPSTDMPSEPLPNRR
jgi:hypothetical protein